MDVCASKKVSKCKKFFSIDDNALDKDWKSDSVWCNPPHTLTKQFAIKADQEWSENNINILMIVPANAICAKYFNEILENNHATYHRINGRPVFLENGRPCSKPARNSYFVVIWREVQR